MQSSITSKLSKNLTNLSSEFRVDILGVGVTGLRGESQCVRKSLFLNLTLYRVYWSAERNFCLFNIKIGTLLSDSKSQIGH